MSINIKRFDPTSMKPHRIILVVGKRGTGKSTLLKDLMFHLREKIDTPLAMTPTEESMNMFEEHMPASCVHTGFNSTLLDKLTTHQRSCSKRKVPMRHVLVVMDDMMFDKKVLKGQAVRDLFMNGRHLRVTYINAMQYLMDMGPDLRSQVDYCFALRENIISNKIKLWKFFFGGFNNFDDFCSVFDACTENNECIVIDNTVKSNNVSDMVFWYKAEFELPKYSLGDQKLWLLHHKYYRTDEEMDKLRQNQPGNPKNTKSRITHISKSFPTSAEPPGI